MYQESRGTAFTTYPITGKDVRLTIIEDDVVTGRSVIDNALVPLAGAESYEGQISKMSFVIVFGRGESVDTIELAAKRLLPKAEAAVRQFFNADISQMT
jgi:hypothetical protein